MLTQSKLRSQLSELGLERNDTVLIHTSFRTLGEVEGGPNGLIDGFCEYLSQGLFVVPTHTWENVTASQPVYNVRTSVPCIGLVPRTAALRTDGIRSLHPTHSVWAYGREAVSFVAGEELAETPAPVGGAWWKLGEMGAKILLIGVGHNRNTFLHAVDEIAGLDDRLNPNTFSVTVMGRRGEQWTHTFRPHGETGSELFGKFEPAFQEWGVQRMGRLGDAAVRVVDAAKARDCLLRIYRHTRENLLLREEPIPPRYWREEPESGIW